MKAKDFALEFLDTVFTSLLIVFFVFYFIVGNHMDVANMIVRIVLPFSGFGILFVIKFRTVRKKIREEGSAVDLDETFAFLTRKDMVRDRAVIAILAVIILVLPIFDDSFEVVDCLQVFIMLAIAGWWHIILFKLKEKKDLITVSYFDKLKDEIIVFFIPIAIMTVALLVKTVDLLDTIQAAISLAGMYFWHRYLFRKAGK